MTNGKGRQERKQLSKKMSLKGVRINNILQCKTKGDLLHRISYFIGFFLGDRLMVNVFWEKLILGVISESNLDITPA